ncbi:hypothetical protein [Nonomuraea sp. SBT364]|uniref:hypothetical protein n=1 Tax=Nonomuraea sp. SBT364 TaxID=1580530 RepID=UPI00066EACA8|nr:hypothetical protein [Nonomuraea sp. SBT364]
MATEHSGAPHLPPSWPEAPREDVPTSWPESPPAAQQPPTAWPEAPPPSWPDAPPAAGWPEPPGRTSQPDQQFSWADATRPDAQPSRHDAPRHEAQPGGEPVPTSWPAAGQPAEPAPAWSEAPPAPPGAWSNLSSPAPWPQHDLAAQPQDTAAHAARPSQDAWPPQESAGQAPRHHAPSPLDAPYSAPPPDQPVVPTSRAADEHTITYSQAQAMAQAQASPAADLRQQPLRPEQPPHQHQPQAQHQQPQQPEHQSQHQSQHGRPGSNLSRDPSDPDRPFVTAGQISGSRTPPPERQQELWDTVFGDDYNAMGEPETLEEGKPIWIYALAGSVAIALVAGLLWAFLAGPLAGKEPAATPPATQETSKTPPNTGKTATTIPRLPKFRGEASGTVGTLPDAAAGITVPRLGGTWRLDERPTVKGTYGFETRQYAMVGTDLAAQVLTGPLPAKLASSYTPGRLEPAIKAVVVDARKRLFATPNKVKKIAQQDLTVGDAKGMLIAYALTSATEKATIVTAALDTGGELPAVVYMSVPEEGNNLRPDINTVINRLKATAQG